MIRKALNFHDDNKELLKKIEELSDTKGTYKFNDTCIELLELGLICRKKGYTILDNKLVRIQQIK